MRARVLSCGLLWLIFALAVAEVAHADSPNSEPQPRTPIKHFIFLMQENHTFDNYFGTYPGAEGLPPDTCMPVDPFDKANSQCLKPFHIGERPVLDLGHSHKIFTGLYRDGNLDGWLYTFQWQQRTDGTISMGYYDDRDLPYYWNVADEYVLFDRFFSSASGSSVWNHMFWVTGTPGNFEEDASIPSNGFGDLPSIFDRLQAKGISWKFYVQNYDPTINYRTRDPSQSDRGQQVVWCPLLDYDRYIDDPTLFSHIVDLSEYYKDLHNGTLPAVAYIVPSGASEHPPGNIRSGERFVRNLINALMKSDAWDSSAFMWSYDDWGGWYDHVVPSQVDAYGYGFRVPALLVSPYAKRGYIDSTQYDFTSALKFIEENWDLAPLAERDASATSIVNAFDFTQAPRPPRLLPDDRVTPQHIEPNRAVVYVSYGAAVIFGVLMISLAVVRTLFGRQKSREQPRESSPK